MKKTILTIVFVIGMIVTSFSQTVIIKNVEKTHGKTYIVSGIYITDESGKTSFIKHESGSFDKSNGANTKLLQSTFNKYFKEGYEIASSTGSGISSQGYGIVFTTYILKKN